MPTIPIANGYSILCDEEDVAALSRYSWHAYAYPLNFPSARTMFTRGGKKTNLFAHVLLMRPKAGQFVVAENSNLLDLRRSNLKVVSAKERAKYTPRVVPGKPYLFTLKATSSYVARLIDTEGRKHHLGSFRTAEEAAAAFREASKRVIPSFILKAAAEPGVSDSPEIMSTLGEVIASWRGDPIIALRIVFAAYCDAVRRGDGTAEVKAEPASPLPKRAKGEQVLAGPAA